MLKHRHGKRSRPGENLSSTHLVQLVFIRGRSGLTGIRRPKRRISPTGPGPVLVAFAAVFVGVLTIMAPENRLAKTAFVLPNPKARLLDQLREVLRIKHYSLRTEETYVQWTTRFLKFHWEQAGKWKHPREMGTSEIMTFLSHLATADHVAGATQNQVFNADGRNVQRPTFNVQVAKRRHGIQV
jgi:hypothetical protein